MQSVSSRIWTRAAVSISYDDNHYTTGTSSKLGHNAAQITKNIYSAKWEGAVDHSTATWLKKFCSSWKNLKEGEISLKLLRQIQQVGFEEYQVNWATYSLMWLVRFTTSAKWCGADELCFKILQNFWFTQEYAASNLEQVLAATPHKTPTVRPPSSYHENYSS